MTERQIQKDFERRQARYEARYRKQFYQYLNSVNRSVASDMVANDTMQVNPSQYLNTDRLQGILVRMYKNVTLNEAKEEYRLENDRGQKDIIDDIINILRPEGSESQLVRVWRNLLNEWVTGRVLDQITEINETTVKRIRKLIEEALLAGQGPRETATQIRNDTQYTLNRSLAIARTESVRAMNQGKFMAALTSPFEKEKTWLSANDARTRQSHREIGNRDEWIPLTSDFILRGERGPEPALYPGDNRLSAAETINCRCSLLTRNRRDANGALIRKKSQRPEDLKLYVTKVEAIDPNDGNLKTWSGPYVIGKSTQDAQHYCDTNNMGYVKVIGPLIQTIDYEAKT